MYSAPVYSGYSPYWQAPAPGSRIVVGMSGGVDSSVTAAILKEQGYEVVGLFMKNWEETGSDGRCTSARDFDDVRAVCDQLDIPYYSVNFVQEYWDQVFSHFLLEYQAGHTPNPDILCNREIKFKAMLQKALSMGATHLATGHYCRNEWQDGRPRLTKGLDAGKDQSYFLYTMQEAILPQVLFPIGGLHKSEVRAIAARYNLATQAKKDSTGICFIGERDFRPFLSKYLKATAGEFRLLDGTVVGQHGGAALYTIGQRKGLNLGGQGEPWFVLGKDVERGFVYVERGTSHPALYCDELTATEASWVAPFAPDTPYRLRAKVRYRQSDQDCVLNRIEEGRLHVIFDQPQRAVTPRQSIVFYDGDRCVGGAMIERAGPSYHARGLPLPAQVRSQSALA